MQFKIEVLAHTEIPFVWWNPWTWFKRKKPAVTHVSTTPTYETINYDPDKIPKIPTGLPDPANYVTIPIRSLPDPDKLELLANFLDRIDWTNNQESQHDLRKWAKTLRDYGVKHDVC